MKLAPDSGTILSSLETPFNGLRANERFKYGRIILKQQIKERNKQVLYKQEKRTFIMSALSLTHTRSAELWLKTGPVIGLPAIIHW